MQTLYRTVALISLCIHESMHMHIACTLTRAHQLVSSLRSQKTNPVDWNQQHELLPTCSPVVGEFGLWYVFDDWVEAIFISLCCCYLGFLLSDRRLSSSRSLQYCAFCGLHLATHTLLIALSLFQRQHWTCVMTPLPQTIFCFLKALTWVSVPRRNFASPALPHWWWSCYYFFNGWPRRQSLVAMDIVTKQALPLIELWQDMVEAWLEKLAHSTTHPRRSGSKLLARVPAIIPPRLIKSSANTLIRVPTRSFKENVWRAGNHTSVSSTIA